MLDHSESWRDSQSLTTILAVVSSILFAALFWIWERELLWMLAVILPPIWSPVIYRRFNNSSVPTANRMAVGALMIGLAVALVVGLLAYLAS